MVFQWVEWLREYVGDLQKSFEEEAAVAMTAALPVALQAECDVRRCSFGDARMQFMLAGGNSC